MGKYGRDWKKVQAHVGTRTTTQARSHAQKFFAKLEKTGIDQLGESELKLINSPSLLPTAFSSPINRPDENQPAAPKRRGKRTARKTLDYELTPPLRKMKIETPIVNVPLIPKMDRKTIKNEIIKPITSIKQSQQMVERQSEQRYPEWYCPCVGQNYAQEQPEMAPLIIMPNLPEFEPEFGQELVEQTKPLELSDNFQLPSAVRVKEENDSNFAIDFSGLSEFS